MKEIEHGLDRHGNKPTRTALLNPFSDRADVKSDNGHACRPEFGQCVAIGFRPDRQDRAEMGANGSNPAYHFLTQIGAMDVNMSR